MRKLIIAILSLLIVVNTYSFNVDSLEVILQAATEDTARISLYHKISWEIKSSDPEKALEYAQKGYEIAENIDDIKGMETCVNNIGVIEAMQGKYDESIASFEKNLELNIQLKLREGEATANNNLGLVYYYKGDFSKAVEHYVTSLKIYDELEDENGKGSTYSNLGLIYENKTNYNKALYYQKKALVIREKLNDPQTLAFSYGNMGNIYYLMEVSDTALIYFLKAEKLFEEINDVHSIGQLIGNIGKIYEDRGELKLAIEYYEKGVSIQEKLGDNYGMSVNLLNISQVKSSQKKWNEAIEYALIGIEKAQSIDAKDVVKQGYGTIRHSYYNSGKYKEAYDYSEKLMELKDSLFSEESQDKIADLETKYGADQKEKENELLRKDSDLKDLKLNRSRIVNYGVSGALIVFAVLGMFIYRGYSEKKKALVLLKSKNDEVVLQKDLIEKKNNDILDSLNYAKRIQYAILPPKSYVDDALPDSFIFYKSKDIVSGDFYWVEKFEDKVLFAAVDCTGHGVPGAFMSIVGYNGLNHVIEPSNGHPATVLDNLNELVSNTLHQAQNTQMKEGMDISFCSIDFKNLKLEFAGAYNSVYIVRGEELIEKKGNRFSIGSKHYRGDKNYTSHVVDLQKGDMIYLTTDGYPDQFGGVENRKFMISNFRKLITSIASKSTNKQKEIVESTIEEWKGSQEQIDDICVIGVRV